MKAIPVPRKSLRKDREKEFQERNGQIFYILLKVQAHYS